MLVNKGALHSWWLAKYSAAFFRISRSSVARLSAALSLLTSYLSASTLNSAVYLIPFICVSPFLFRHYYMSNITGDYQGVPKESFPLFLKECEFRFNYGSPKQQLIILKEWAGI